MGKREEIILVFGATGNQGGAVARHLLADGWRVRAVSRNPEKPESRALAAAGAELVEADMEDRDAIARAMKGVHGVFSVQNFWTSGFEAEIRQGKNVADAAAAAAGVKHFVYTSVCEADGNSSLPHFESKWQIEQYIEKLGLPVTVLRPVFFMDNFHATPFGFGDNIRNGSLYMALKPKTKLQMIGVDDVGVFALKVFQDRQEFLGRVLELAGDELTMPETAQILSQYQERPVQHVQVPIDQVRSQKKEWADMLEWFDAKGYEADIPKLRKIHPDLMNLHQWAARYWKTSG